MAKFLGSRQNPTATQLLEHRVRELSTLHEIARAVTSVLDLESALNRIVEAAVYLTNAEEGFLLLVDEQTGDLTLSAGKGLGEKASRVMNLKVSDSIAGQVVRTGRPVRMGGFRRDEQYKVKTGYLVRSLVNVPVKFAGRVIGVLAVDHSVASLRSFSDHDVALLSSLADYAAIAIQNAFLFAQASAKAAELGQVPGDKGVASQPPFSGEVRRALEQFAHGLRAQRKDVIHGIESARKLAQDLQAQAQAAEEVSKSLGIWDEEVLTLLPQLESLVQPELPGTEPRVAGLAEAPSPAEATRAAVPVISDTQLLQHLADGVLLCDAEGIIRQVNGMAVQILNRAEGDLVSSELQGIIEDPHWQQMVGSLRLALAMGAGGGSLPSPSEMTLYINDRVIRAKLFPISDSHAGAGSVIVTTLRDISAETRGWRARDEALAALSQRMRSLMAAIASYSDLLLLETTGMSDGMQRRYLQRIRQAVERLEAVLDASEGGSASSNPRITPALASPVDEVIHQAMNAAQKVLSLDGVNILDEVGTDLPPVQVDAGYVSRILTDLLAAVGARTAFGESISVATQIKSIGERAGHLVVLIQGGSAARQDLVPLEEEDNVRTATSLAQDLGGRIWVEHKADGSTLLCFLLPVAEGE